MGSAAPYPCAAKRALAGLPLPRSAQSLPDSSLCQGAGVAPWNHARPCFTPRPLGPFEMQSGCMRPVLRLLAFTSEHLRWPPARLLAPHKTATGGSSQRPGLAPAAPSIAVPLPASKAAPLVPCSAPRPLRRRQLGNTDIAFGEK